VTATARTVARVQPNAGLFTQGVSPKEKESSVIGGLIESDNVPKRKNSCPKW